MSTRLTEQQGANLVRLAVEAVYAQLTGRPPDPPRPADPVLVAPGASFVTLESRGVLRGCVGTLQQRRPLYLDVAHNARSAMTDPRLPPVSAVDWPTLDVKVSVLSPLEPIRAGSRAELITALRPGVDGLVLRLGERRATFLPVVWERLAEPERFVSALLAKGRWPAEGWPDGVQAWRYTSDEYSDPAPRTRLG